MTARELAADLPDGATVDWRELQASAFERHPSVLEALDPRSGVGGVRERATTVGLVAIGLVAFAVFVAPIVAIAFLIVDWISADSDPAASIPVASILFLCTIPLLAIVFVDWYRSDRKRERVRELQVSVLAGFGLLSLVVALLRSGVQDYPDGVRWSAGIAVPALFAGIFWVKLLIDAHRLEVRYGAGAPESQTDGGLPPLEPLGHVRVAVEKLPESDRAAVRADLDAAIDELERRELIDGDTAVWAHRGELGKLPMHMRAWRGSSAEPG